jgi:hypothetical protein
VNVPKKRKVRRCGKAPPGLPIQGQPEFRLQLLRTQNNSENGTTQADYPTGDWFANNRSSGSARLAQLLAIATASDGAASEDNIEVCLHELRTEVGIPFL